MNSLILSAALCWSVFSWSAPSTSAILTEELSMSMAVHRATLHRRHCIRVQCTPFSSCVTIHVFFRMLKNWHSLLFPFLFFGGRRKTQSEETLVMWELLPAAAPFSTLAIRKMSLFSVHIIYTQDPLNALILSLLLKICILNAIFALSLIC